MYLSGICRTGSGVNSLSGVGSFGVCSLGGGVGSLGDGSLGGGDSSFGGEGVGSFGGGVGSFNICYGFF